MDDNMFLLKLIATGLGIICWLYSILQKELRTWTICGIVFTIAAMIFAPSYNIEEPGYWQFNSLTAGLVAIIGYITASGILAIILGGNNWDSQSQLMDKIARTAEPISASPYQAMEILEQRKYIGRDTDRPVYATLQRGCDWGEWRYAAFIWQMKQIDRNYNVHIEFKDKGDIPTYDNGYIVPSTPHKIRDAYKNQWQISKKDIETVWRDF